MPDPTPPGPERPWHRRPGEPARAYQAFGRYLAMGPMRTLPRVASEWDLPDTSVRRWSARWEWVSRCAAYDSEELLRQMEARAERREQLRQRIYDEADALVSELVGLAHGQLVGGDEVEMLDKHQQVIGSRPAVPPSVRRGAIMDLIGLCGLVLPKRVEVTGKEGDELRMQVRSGLREADPAVVRRLEAVLSELDP